MIGKHVRTDSRSSDRPQAAGRTDGRRGEPGVPEIDSVVVADGKSGLLRTHLRIPGRVTVAAETP